MHNLLFPIDPSNFHICTVHNQKLWPKSTMEGVRSAISSRQVLSKTMEIQFQRVTDDMSPASASEGSAGAGADSELELELVQEFELSLSRPMGIHIEGTFCWIRVNINTFGTGFCQYSFCLFLT